MNHREDCLKSEKKLPWPILRFYPKYLPEGAKESHDPVIRAIFELRTSQIRSRTTIP
jgi:hypothetical protein